jgi:dipeptidyl aminopeptidase/acylaminoacyl peptidase
MPTNNMRTAALATTLVVALVTSLAQPVRGDLPPLIPRDVLFDSPEKAAPAISPDGRRLAYLAPSNGLLAVWERTLGATDDHIVASDPKRPIGNVAWAPDSHTLLYQQDQNGDENFHIYAVSADGGTLRDLTPFDGVRADVVAVHPAASRDVLIQMNKRDKTLFDVYRLDPASGKLTLDTQNPGNVMGWVEDASLRVRASLIQRSDGSFEIDVRDSAGAPWRKLVKFSADDGQPSPEGFSTDGASLYVTANAGANVARLLSYDLATGKASTLYQDPGYDVEGTYFAQGSRRLVAATVQREHFGWVVIDPSYRADFSALIAAHRGDVRILSGDAADRTLVVSYTVADGPVAFYTYDRDTKSTAFLFSARPALETLALANMQPIEYQARDGLTIHGYLTLPVGVEPKKLPMVLLVHGGPWARDVWGYIGAVQWLANRGYAVLQPNFRGSTGYGRAFLNAGDRQWAGTMHTDLLDAKDWAVAQGIADPKRVCIMGGSYGGYATLAGLAYSPDAFACGVDRFGPSNLNTLLAAIPPYWQTARAMFDRRMGDTPEILSAQSPLFKADQIKAPLLIGQGLHDPRVNVRESDQIVAALRQRGTPVIYVVFPDEGHGFLKPDNIKRFNAQVESFLAKYLYGRDEPPKRSENISAFLK